MSSILVVSNKAEDISLGDMEYQHRLNNIIKGGNQNGRDETKGGETQV